MSFTIEEQKEYSVSAEKTYAAALKAIAGLEGKVGKQNAATHTVSAKFHKTILGKVLGDRTELSVAVNETGTGASEMQVTIFPLNAVGQKLMFGARKGVSRTVLTWFYAHVDHHLSKPA